MKKTARYLLIGLSIIVFGKDLFTGEIGDALIILVLIYWQASYFELYDKFDAFKKIAAETATEAKELINQYKEKNKMVDKLLEDIEIVVKKGDV